VAAAPGVYVDATALIGLARIDRLDLLTVLAVRVRVTAHVWREVAADPSKRGTAALRAAEAAGLLVVVAEGNPAAFPQLDAGEATVLSAAASVGGVVVVDERKARALIETDEALKQAIRGVTGIVGLLLLAKQRGRVPAVRPLVDQLIGEQFWIGPSFRLEVLRQAGEL
jgi:predicted nucleic acid-binding protein